MVRRGRGGGGGDGGGEVERGVRRVVGRGRSALVAERFAMNGEVHSGSLGSLARVNLGGLDFTTWSSQLECRLSRLPRRRASVEVASRTARWIFEEWLPRRSRALVS